MQINRVTETGGSDRGTETEGQRDKEADMQRWKTDIETERGIHVYAEKEGQRSRDRDVGRQLDRQT